MKIKNFNGYEIFPEEGKIWSYKTNKFVGAQLPNGYWIVGLTDDDGEQHHFLLHRLIWQAVHGEIPENMEINHTTEDKNMNGIQFLELVDKKTNINYGTRTARAAEKLTNRQDLSKQVGAYKDGVLVMTFPSTQEAQRQGFNQGNISQCCRNCYLREGNNTYRGYKWRYLN